MRFIWVSLMVLCLFPGLSACAAKPLPAQAPNPQETGAQTGVPVPEESIDQTSVPTSIAEETEMSPGTPNPSSDKMAALVKENLAQKLKITPDQISVSDVKAVVWRDASLGCPKPGVDYIQVETPGYSIVLEADGKTYQYHTDQDKRFVLCRS